VNDDFLKKLIVPAETKIFMLIMDGLGGLPKEPGGLTELESADKPNMNALALHSALGLSSPAGPGIAVGSGPGHLAIFGYDPIENEIGRGALEALGVDFELGPDDVAARGNFCTVDENGILIDRRAGRIATPQAMQLAEILNKIRMDGVELFIRPVKEHRFAFVIRGEGLGAGVTKTDPLTDGVAPLAATGLDAPSQRTAEIVNRFIEKVRVALADEQPANMILLRGFDKLPALPKYQDRYGLNAAAIAVNGMYKGVARLAGMKILPVDGATIEDEFTTLERYWNDFDFFYLHIKQTDTHGEDGDFDRKVRVIEEVDQQVARAMALKPDVVIITGDHSSPTSLKSHSWHPVPLLLFSKNVREDGIGEFGERACVRGSLGIMPAKDVMLLALANAGRISKYGA